MGLDMTYGAGEEKLTFRLPPSDIDVLEVLRKKGFEPEIETIFGVSDFGEDSDVETEGLFVAVGRLLHSIKKDPHILPYTYSVKSEVSRGSGMYSSGTGVISGFRIHGEPHSIEGGLDRCVLSKLRQDEAGLWRDCEAKDVRSLKVIQIDEDNLFGDITISKRRKPSRLIHNLDQLKTFLSKTQVDVIQKTLG